GLAHRAIETRLGVKILQLAVVGEAPVAAPQLTGKRMGVGQRHRPGAGLADMTDHHLALDGVTLHQTRHFRVRAGGGVLEQAQPPPLVKTDAPAITVRAGATTALHQAGEAENDVGGHVGAHAEQFAHDRSLVRPAVPAGRAARPPPSRRRAPSASARSASARRRRAGTAPGRSGHTWTYRPGPST